MRKKQTIQTTVHDKEDQDQTHVVRKLLYKRKTMMINETNIGKDDMNNKDRHFILYIQYSANFYGFESQPGVFSAHSAG